MGEQRNLTEGNVEELRTHLERMKAENPELEYRFFEQKEEGQLQSSPTNRELMDKLESIERLLNLIFDGHVLINGTFQQITYQINPTD